MEDLGGHTSIPSIRGGCDHLVRTQRRDREAPGDDGVRTGAGALIERREPRAPRFDFREMMRSSPIALPHINIKETINCLADDGYFHEYKANYGLARGASIVCGKMWLKGIPVGVIASNASGVIYIEAARKATE